jgi:hypothetical protein
MTIRIEPGLSPLMAPFTMVVDSREQHPYTFAAIRADADAGRRPVVVPIVSAGLPAGDYSIEGLENVVAVERKSLQDCFSTLGQGRARFVRELERLAQYEFAAVVVEAEWSEIIGFYSAGLRELRNHFATLAAKGQDDSQPWAVWADMLSEAMPGPPVRSRLNPKTVYRSVIAWQMRYPRVVWWPCPGRAFAEVTTYRLLERFHKEREAKSRG